MRVYDLEVFAKDYLVGIYNGKEYIQLWNNDLDKIREDYEKHQDDIWVGHNSSNYDNILYKLILLGKSVEEIKGYSDAIINGSGEVYLEGQRRLRIDNTGTNKMKRDLGLNKIKLYDWDILNDKVVYSLKQAEGYLGLKIYESDIDFNLDRPLTKEERLQTEEYNRADLYATWLEMLEQKESIKIRMALIKEYNLPKSLISATNQKITGEILEGQYTKYNDQLQKYDSSIAPIEINNPEYHKALEMFTNCDKLDYKNKMKIDIAGVEHTIAIGGIHRC